MKIASHFVQWASLAGLLLAPVTAAQAQATATAPVATAPAIPAFVPPPREVLAIFNTALNECREEEGRFTADPTGFYETADFNGDGRDDYFVSMAELQCSTSGASAYCGSAGCVQTILLSEGDRLREVFNANLQGYAIVRLPNGRQGVAVATHGSTCGNRAGADTCYGMMNWNGRAWVTTRVRSLPPGTSLFDENGVSEPASTRLSWRAVPANAQQSGLAMMEGHPQLPLILIHCDQGVPVIGLRMGVNSQGRGLPLPASGRPLTLSLIQEYDENLEPVTEDIVMATLNAPREYAGRLTPRAIMMLAGGEDRLTFELGVANGAYWLPADPLSLNGSTAAIRAALASCMASAPAPRKR